jgi:hypothetical protein
MHVVIILETESDFPGVKAVFGPYTYEVAERVANTMSAALGVNRGEHVQVSSLELL